MKLFRLAKANIIRKKELAITITLFLLLAAMMLNMGISQLANMNQFYEAKDEQLKSPHFYAVSPKNQYKKEYEDFLQKDDRVEDVEVESVILMPTTKNDRNNFEFPGLIFNKDTNRTIAPFQLVEEDQSVPSKEAIYMPLIMKGYHVNLGDSIEFDVKGEKYTYRVAGFFETTYMGIASCGLFKYYVSQEAFDDLYPKMGGAYILSARLGDSQNLTKVDEFTKDFGEKTCFSDDNNELMSMIYMSDKSTMKMQILSMLGLPAAIFIAIALVISTVFILMIFFKVLERIDESMQELGALRAIGYTTKQIKGFVVLEIVMISSVGIILGTILSYLVSFGMKSSFETASGLIWQNKFQIHYNVLCAILLLGFVLISSYLGTRKLSRLTPVTMLRKGMKTHSHIRNFIPLDKGFGSIHMRIAQKNLFSYLNQNLILLFIISLCTFVMGVSMVLFLNFAVDQSALKEITGIELSDLQVKLSETADIDELQNRIEQREEVRKTIQTSTTTIKLNDERVMCIISDAFDQMEITKVCEGVFPKYDNEIVISYPLSKKLNKKIGDPIEVSFHNKTREYMVVGLSQTTNGNGKMAYIAKDGILKIQPDFKMTQIDVYLKKGFDRKTVIHEFEDELRNRINTSLDEKYQKAIELAEKKMELLIKDYGVNSLSYSIMLGDKIIVSGNSNAYQIKEIGDLKGYLDGQLELYATILFGIVMMIIGVNFLIMSGALILCIGTIFRNNQMEFGVYKAIGYSNKDLMKQLFLNFFIVSVLGASIGTIITLALSNHILMLMFQFLDIQKINLVMNPIAMLGIGLSVVVFVMAVSLFKVRALKKVSAYELIIE